MQEFLLVVVLLLCSVSGYPSGPPAADYPNVVCKELSPSLQTHGPSHSGHGGYLLQLQPPLTKAFHYEPGVEYNVELVGTTHFFKGFIIQARDPATPPPAAPRLIGQFTAVSDGAKTLSCDQGGVSAEATVAHSNALPRSLVQLTWTAPLSNGTVDFFYTVMREKAVHFDQLSAAQLGPPPVSVAPSNTLPPIKTPDKYRLQFQNPSGCGIGDCNVYVAIDTNRGNDSWLDIYMEGKAEGWVGVGFTHSAGMFEADAVACNRLGDKMVVLDLFNPGGPSHTSLTDEIQDVYLFEGKYMDGRLSCKVIKRILPSDEFDINLNQDLYVLFGKRSKNASTLDILNAHDFAHLPEISDKKINITYGNGTATGENKDFENALVKTHASLMLITWPLLVVTAIFFPVFMKPALPSGGWFQIHRALMLTSVVVGAVGFASVFIGHIHKATPGLIPLGQGKVLNTAHFSVGILVMALHLVNPIIGLLRCNPDNPRRWIFDLLHGKVVGLISLLLALVNIATGAYLLDPSIRVFWVVMAWEVVFLVTVLAFLTTFSFLAARSPSTERALRAPSTIQALFKTGSLLGGLSCLKRGKLEEITPLISSGVTGDNKLRWASFYFLTLVSVALVVAAVVLTAVTTRT
ncbi:putative ferric-chelate reductase 1 [Halichondria panicea]|uniref:putative ferric-chelate reductase 1 n=1 Tax=Halichondria panicea TaxID=6063 RepID=UPI00312B4609